MLFRNFYRCATCGCEWTDVWPAILLNDLECMQCLLLGRFRPWTICDWRPSGCPLVGRQDV